jgi:hypothetical protein
MGSWMEHVLPRLLLLVAIPAVGADYYVSPDGVDSNTGSAGRPWRSISGALSRAAPGDTVHLQAGATFNENVYMGTGGEVRRPVTLTSDPVRRATVRQADASQPGLLIYNAGHLIIENLVVVGSGARATDKEGIALGADAGRYAGLTFRNLDVSGFRQGFHLYAAGGAANGIDDVLIEKCAASQNRNAGIETYADAVGGISNIVLRDCVFAYNLGDPELEARPSGFGVSLSHAVDGLIERCVAHDNGGQGAARAGPVGFMVYNSRRIVVQHCEAYRTQAIHMDGDGFDLDLNTCDSRIQYCYAHDNFGAGFLLSTDGTTGAWTNNTFRYCISENDGIGGKMGGLHVYSPAGSAPLRDSHVYHNTILSRVSPAVWCHEYETIENLWLGNNVFVTAAGRPVLEGSPAATQVRFQNNTYWAGGGACAIAGYDSLNAWRRGTGQETLDGKGLGVSADPRLQAARGAVPSAVHPQRGSPVIDAGLNLRTCLGVDPGATDFFGTPVPQLRGRDMGAVEFRGAVPGRTGRAP